MALGPKEQAVISFSILTAVFLGGFAILAAQTEALSDRVDALSDRADGAFAAQRLEMASHLSALAAAREGQQVDSAPIVILMPTGIAYGQMTENQRE